MPVEIDISRFDATTKGGPSTGGVVGRGGLCRIAFGEGNQQRLKRSTILHYFTLIELLVVVAVLAILMSLMYPSLRRALREAQEVVCMNNIHQLSMAAINYSSDYIDNYPPPITYLSRDAGPMSRKFPNDLKLSDINHIAYYLGLDPNNFRDNVNIPLTEAMFPSNAKCPFTIFRPGGNLSMMNLYEVRTGNVENGYGYFGRLEWSPVGWGSHTGVLPAFKRKYADRFSDPDAALWGDVVSQYIGGWRYYTHTYGGSPKPAWTQDPDFLDMDRQNMGRVDGSVVIRWASEINANIQGIGVGHSGWGAAQEGAQYGWWFASLPN